MKTTIKRISGDLESEISKISKKNAITFTEASKEVAKLIRMNKNKKIERIIEF